VTHPGIVGRSVRTARALFGGGGFVVSDSLISYYPFNDGTADDQEGDNDGTVSGASFISDGGPQSDGAYSFDATDDVIDIGNVAELGGGLGSNYTLNTWVKPASGDLDGTYNQVLGKQGPNGLDTYRLGINNSDFYFLAGDSNDNFDSITTSVAPSAGTWYMVTARYTNGDIEIFVDGVSEVSKASGLADASSNYNSVSIGASVGSGNYYLGGDVDTVRIHDISLSDTQIQEIYDAEKA